MGALEITTNLKITIRGNVYEHFQLFENRTELFLPIAYQKAAVVKPFVSNARPI